MITIKASTLQRLLDLLPTKTHLSTAVDDFLAAIHAKGGDAITALSRGDTEEVTIAIRVRK